MLSLSIATFQLVRNAKYRELTERRQRIMPVVLYINTAMVILDLSVGGSSLGIRLLLDVMLTALALSLLSSSLWTASRSRMVVYFIMALQVMLSMYYILCLVSLSSLPHPICFRNAAVVVAVSYSLLFLWGIWVRLRVVREVMRSGTVWVSLTLAVDSFYMVVVLTEFVLALLVWNNANPFLSGIITLMLCGAVAAQGIRIACDKVFVLLHRHERRIVESMKISPAETAGTGQKEDDMYRDIYDRVQEYFEKDKPFLNGNLTINDIVGVVFTNKLYISRAISQCSGRNFCQFVNYHRIMYSVDCFRRNSELKVAELWPMCGFNSIVSYNMAFRLFMGENPSDWCRKEKIRLSRKEK